MRRWLLLPAFFLVAGLLTFPILKNNVLPGEDYLAAPILWATWFPSYAIPENMDYFVTNYSLYPVEKNWLSLISLPTTALYTGIAALTGIWLGFNLLFPLYLSLLGWGGYLWLRSLTTSDFLACLGGAVLAFNPLTYSLAQQGSISLLGFFLFPLWLAGWDYFVRQPRLWMGLLLAVGLWLIALFSIQFWNLILTLLLPYALYQGWYAADRLLLLRVSLVMLILFGILCVVSPVRDTASQIETAEIWTGMRVLHGLTWQIFWIGGLMLLLLMGLLIQWERNTRVQFWAGLFFLHFVIMLNLRFAPLTLFDLTPPLTQKTPLLMTLVLCALPILVTGMERFIQPQPRPVFLGAGLVLVIGVSQWWQPLPVTRFTHHVFYEQAGDVPDHLTLIDFPLAADSLAHRLVLEQGGNNEGFLYYFFTEIAGRTQLYAPQHHKATIGGITNTLYKEDFAAYDQTALMYFLTFQNTDHLFDNPTEMGAALRQNFADWQVGYVVLHPTASIPPEFIEAIRQWLHWTGTFCLNAAFSQDGLEVWQSTTLLVGCPPQNTVTLVEEAGRLAIDRYPNNWYEVEYWAEGGVRWAGPRSTSRLDLWVQNPAVPYQLVIRGAAPAEASPREVQVRVNGTEIGLITLTDAFQDFSMTIPRELIPASGLIELALEHPAGVTVEGRTLHAVYQSFTLLPQPIEPVP